MANLKTLVLKLPRESEVTPEAAQTFLAALTQINSVGSIERLLGKKAPALALEIVLFNQQIRFQVVCDETLVDFVTTQIQSNYPLALIQQEKDPLESMNFEVSRLYLTKGSYYPIASYPSFQDVDPLSSVLSVMAKSDPEEITLIQYCIEATSQNWQTQGRSYSERGTKNEDGTYSPRSDADVIKQKISHPGFKTSIRIASNMEKTTKEIANAYGVFAKSDGNNIYSKRPGMLSTKKESQALQERRVTDSQILNIEELATLWHLPSEKIKIPSILWGKAIFSEPPENLPASIDATDEEKKKINFFAKTLFKNKETIFGIKDNDRTRHIWTVGKTGTGKSTMIANMGIDDFKKDRGIGIIDPHGDLCDDVLDYIPSHRINDTIYFNPADRDFPIVLNPLEVTNREEAELVVSGLMAIFTKVWANVWSARMEYILRNAFMTLSEVPNTTLEDVLKILSNQSYRNKIVGKLDDSALVHFWQEEFDKMPDKLQKEAISPIQNKVGQFVTSPMIRRIIGKPKSTISIDEIMDEGKILLANLSQGRLGEDNAQLLGAMLITKFQLAAMRRVDMPKESRRPFYLYVDEFQNFATSSFLKILSEARKYNLALTLANQYMAQIPEDVRKAILGNAGTLISFGVGAEDALILNKEFGEVFTDNDLINLQNFQIAIKLMIDGYTSRPFLANTLPLPASKNQNRDKVVRVSRERWARKPSESPSEAGSEIKSEKKEPQDKLPKDSPLTEVSGGTVFENE